MSRRRGLAVAAAAVTSVVVGACGGGDIEEVDEVTVTGAWARPTPDGATAGVVYLRVVSPVDDVLAGVTVPVGVAGAATVHESSTGSGGDGHSGHLAQPGDDMVVMVDAGRVDLEAGRPVELEPGGLHVMLTDLVEPLEIGERFELTLQLERGGDVTTEVVVGVSAP